MFLTDLVDKRVINLRSTYKLVEDLIWQDQVFSITVPSGFLYDGASVPLLATLLFPKKGGLYDRAACLHDWLYGTHLLPREAADRIFYQAMLYDNVPKWKAWCMYKAVRLGGSSAYHDKTPEQVEELRSLATK